MTAKKQVIEDPAAESIDVSIPQEPAVVAPQLFTAIARSGVMANGKLYRPGDSIPNLSYADYQYLLSRKAVTKG